VKKNYNNIPFAPKKWPFFYGWAILVLSSIGVIMSMPGQTMGVSAFTEHLIKSLKISRSQLALAYMFGTLVSSFILPYAGKVYDKAGARIMAFAASVGMGLTLILLSFSDRFAAGLSPFGVVVMMFFGFLLLRFWGQGVLTLTCRNMLMKWFDRKRGLVTGLSGPIVSLGFSATPLALHTLITYQGWQNSWLILGVVSVLVFSSIAVIFFRDNPEGCGLLPDGDHLDGTVVKEKPRAVRQYTVAEVKRTFSFWVIGLALSLCGFFFTAVPFHIVSIFKLAGMSKTTAFSIFFYSSCISITMNLVFGYISDKIQIKYLLYIMLSGFIISTLSLAFLAPGFTFITMIIGMGLGGGLFGIMANIPFPRFYGRTHLGAINGFIMSMMVFASAIGPWFFSKVLDHSGSYRYAALSCTIFAATLLICSFKVKNPQIPTRNSL
jgi:MFS transporter, OFA family, oxalate/formate antiporter